jgi:replicative DNA helicase
MSQDRLPQSPEAERAVLGGLMIESGYLSDVAECLQPKDFRRDAHGFIFRIMLDMLERGDKIEMLSVVDRLVSIGREAEAGGVAYVSALPDQVPSTENILYYAGLVREASVRRRVIEAAEGLSERARDGSVELSELLDGAQTSIAAITDTQAVEGWYGLEELLHEEGERITRLVESPGVATGLPTGFPDLDQVLHGWQPTNLVIVAARPAAGKTAMALNMIRHVAGTPAGDPLVAVGIFSLEMGRRELVTRLLQAEARVDATGLHTGYLTEEEQLALHEASQRLAPLQIQIDDTPGLTAIQLRNRARKLKARFPNLGLIVVDYIGLMSGDLRLSREQQVSGSSRILKGLAKELGITVICLSQLNRTLEHRPDKRPMLSDLRESGAIEQDADIVLFIYRDELYNKETTCPGEAELIIAKNRSGATKVVRLAFVGKHTRFDSLAR